ncbi:MAG TPA: bifunctional phosphoribosyl-AMP cyclohydrolase/phosphoribosyl-ATP diphosphatase HisIE, partial [Nitrospira sp.]|nr:bifunctional phosphoribosyl-AMP cyclohydrolase/phosphoribosyl-ATP diphosphatase HisIE [Nitrospira sp.]
MSKESRTMTFDGQGLIPAVIQDWLDGTVLMVGYMNQEAIAKTLQTRSVHFWSRSRRKLWEKGETSGHFLKVKDLFVDCDRDTILVKAEPVGPTCHTGERACFFARMTEEGQAGEEKTQDAGGGILDRVYQTILTRKASPQPDSYVSKLLQGGADRILKKVAEEAGEVIIAAKNQKRERMEEEAGNRPKRERHRR